MQNAYKGVETRGNLSIGTGNSNALFELVRHWARRSGVSERKEDLESVRAKKILVVTIEVVDVLVGVGVSVVRAEAIVVT